MAANGLVPNITVKNNTDWLEEPFEFFLGDLTEPDSFAGCTAEMGLRLVGRYVNALEPTTVNGMLAFTADNEISIVISNTYIKDLPLGDYVYDIILNRPGGEIEEMISGTMTLELGLA